MKVKSLNIMENLKSNIQSTYQNFFCCDLPLHSIDFLSLIGAFLFSRKENQIGHTRNNKN